LALRSANSVTYSTYCLDQLRVAPGCGYLASQRLDVTVNGTVGDGEPVAPHAIDELRAREHAFWCASEFRQQIELDPGQFQLTLTAVGTPRLEVGAERRSLGGGAFCLVGTPQHGPDPGHDFAGRERLRHIVVSAAFQGRDSIALRIAT